MLLQEALLPAAYFLGKFRRVEPGLVVLADAHHDRRPESLDRLARGLEKTGDRRVVEWYRDFGKMSLPGQLTASVSFMFLYARAGAVVLCDNFLPASSCRKRKETALVQLWHGPGAFKKFGYDAKDDIPPYYRGHVYRNYDLVTVSGPACVKPFCSAMRLSEKVVRPLGISRMDDCVQESWRRKCREEFAACYPEAAGKKVLLWAPTFRGNAGHPEAVGLEAVDALAEALGEDWLVVRSLHPHLKKWLPREDCFGRLPSERMLPAADVFMTDYSSLVYDACLQGCRVLVFAPDRKAFLEERGTYMALEEIPGALIEDPGENAGVLAEAVRETAASYDFGRQKDFVQRYLGACDGHATERVISFLKGKRW